MEKSLYFLSSRFLPLLVPSLTPAPFPGNPCRWGEHFDQLFGGGGGGGEDELLSIKLEEGRWFCSINQLLFGYSINQALICLSRLAL